MVQKKYMVFFDLKPGVMLSDKYGGFNIDIQPSNIKISITKIEEDSGEVRYQTGLRFKCELPAETIEQAIDTATPQVEFFCDTLGFIGGVGLDSPEFWIAYESTDAVPEREFIQQLRNPFVLKASQGAVSKDYLFKFFLGFNHYGPEEHERLMRALHWFRMGVNEQDKFDSYICQWTALETLEPVFLKKLGMTAKENKCECGRIFKPPTKVTGLPAYFDTVDGAGKDLYYRLGRLRNDIVHGNDSFTELTNRLEQLQPQLTKMLIGSFHFLSNIPQPIKERVMIKRAGIYIRYSTKLIGFEPHGIHQNQQTPHFIIDKIQYQPSHTENGLNMQLGWENNLHFPDGVSIKNYTVHALGMDPDMTFSDMRMR